MILCYAEKSGNGENKIECIFFSQNRQTCIATGSLSPWKPDLTTIQKSCKSDSFRNCPRYIAVREMKKKP